MRLAQIDSAATWLNFFRFDANPQQAAFYRPLSTQVFFWLGYVLFGLHALPYYLITVGLFLISIWLLARFTRRLTNSSWFRWMVVILYALSQTHFSHLYFLSAAQEIFLVATSLLFLFLLIRPRTQKTPWLLSGCFILALMSKETAVVLPLLGYITLVYRNGLTTQSKVLRWLGRPLKDDPASWLSLGVIEIVYLYARWYIFGFTTAGHATYSLSFSPVMTLQTVRWYGLWSLGAPETLQDYLSSWWQVLPRFFRDYPTYGQPMLILLVVTGLCLLWVMGRWVWQLWTSRKSQTLLPALLPVMYGAVWFGLTLLPVLFFPQHRFALELGLPMIGFAWVVASLLTASPRWLQVSFLTLFLSLQLVSVLMTQRTHYSVLRSDISERAYAYFQQNYPTWPQQTYFVFMNDTADYGAAWGSSKQISQALMQDNFFQVLYPDDQVAVYYQDEPFIPPQGLRRVELSTQQFVVH